MIDYYLPQSSSEMLPPVVQGNKYRNLQTDREKKTLEHLVPKVMSPLNPSSYESGKKRRQKIIRARVDGGHQEHKAFRTSRADKNILTETDHIHGACSGLGQMEVPVLRSGSKTPFLTLKLSQLAATCK